ncbi:uncharacterized protein isoform X1 [Choristoneura fumiferana]|uniref:uncharacterized protein isoform X1 n=2 Tax=Choristoneura fumiferana TaxID=7141 RepID=UPI003D15D7F3
MEKESYEMYEYLPASGSNTEAEPYQFFVVQDDGTFLINRQVQYVTQVQDVKEPLEGEQHCTMLDVAPQQFYVDIDSTTEMIVSDQLNIPEGTSNLYASSYLLQPGAAAPVDQIDNNVMEQPKPNEQAESSLPDPNKDANSLTEITLTDAQYQMLEQKGWILLETNEKVYVLDTLGLHDITTNDKLIEKLKIDDTATNLEPESGQLKIEFSSSLGDMDVDIPIVHEHNELKSSKSPEPEFAGNVLLIEGENKDEVTDKLIHWDNKKVSTDPDALQATQVHNLDNDVSDIWKYENVVRIRTDFLLKDIPDKIILGKTKNGKRLVCKVIRPDKKPVRPIKKDRRESDLVAIAESVQRSILTGTDDAGDDQLDTIFRKCFEDSTANYSADDVTFAGNIIKELQRLPAVKPSIANRNMLVTRVSVNETESSTIESPPTLVTGTVQTVQEGCRFLYKPELYLIAKKELSQESSADGIDHNFLHMHVHEIQQNGKVVRTAVTLNKRRLAASSTRNPEKIYIPDLPLSVPESSAADTDNSMYGYACGTCAAIFRSEKEFDVHKVTHQMDEEKPIIDTEQSKLNKNSILVLADPYHKGKTYCCMQCNAKFQRLNNCQRHVKSHILPTEAGIKQAFKCKICHSFFHHAPTLLKHIMKSHIKIEK